MYTKHIYVHQVRIRQVHEGFVTLRKLLFFSLTLKPLSQVSFLNNFWIDPCKIDEAKIISTNVVRAGLQWMKGV